MRRDALALADMQRGRLLKNEKSVSEHLPYTHFAAPDVVATRDGMLMLTLNVSGLSTETADPIDMNDRLRQRGHVFRTVTSPDVALYYHFVRRRSFGYPASDFVSFFARQLDDEWRERIADQCSYRNDHYITLCAKPRVSETKKRLFGRSSLRISDRAFTEALEKLREQASLVRSALSEYEPRILALDDDMRSSEVLSLYSFLLTGEWRTISPPRMNLSNAVAPKRLTFGRETIELRGVVDDDTRFAAMLGLREYPAGITSRTLDELNGVAAELVVTHSFAPQPRDIAQAEIAKQQRRMFSADDAAASLRDRLTQAQDDVASGRLIFGRHHVCVTVFSGTTKRLREDLSVVRSILTNAGLTVAREDINLEPAFWSTCPGNFAYASGRAATINNDNLAAFIGLGSPQAGEPASIWGPPITVFPTTAMTPYAFNFHVDDVGNTVLFGPTGGGKTALLSFLISQAERVRPRIIVMDKDRGAEIIIRALGGRYATLVPGEDAELNPFLIDDGDGAEEGARAFLADWVTALLFGDQADAVTPPQKEAIRNAVSEVRDAPPDARQLELLSQVIGGGPSGADLIDRLRRWIGSGDRAWAFNSRHDRFSDLFADRIIGIDLTKILDDRDTASAWMLYLFNRIEQALTEGRPTLIVLDEAWRMLSDSLFASRIQNWMKVIRKLNGAVIFATQEPEDAIESAVGRTVIQQSPTQILLPNARANEHAYLEGLRVSEYELTLLRQMGKVGRHMMIRRENNSVLVRFDLSGLPQFIDVLSARAETVMEMDQLMASHGDRWLTKFMQRRMQ